MGQLGSYAESSSGPKMLFYFISSEFLDFLIPAWRKQFLLLLEFGDMRNGNEDQSWSHELVSLADKSVVICSTKAYNISSIKLNWRPEMSRYNQLHKRIKNLLPVRLFTFFYGRLKVCLCNTTYTIPCIYHAFSSISDFLDNLVHITSSTHLLIELLESIPFLWSFITN